MKSIWILLLIIIPSLLILLIYQITPKPKTTIDTVEHLRCYHRGNLIFNDNVRLIKKETFDQICAVTIIDSRRICCRGDYLVSYRRIK